MSVIDIILLVAAVVVASFVFARDHQKLIAAYGAGPFALLIMVMVTAVVVYLLAVGPENAYYVGMIFLCFLYYYIITLVLPDYVLAKRNGQKRSK